MEKKEKDNEYVDFVVTARKYKTTLTAKYKNRKMWHKPFVGDVISHLPGTIVKVEVQQGQEVEAGQLLLIHPARQSFRQRERPPGCTSSSPGGSKATGRLRLPALAVLPL